MAASLNYRHVFGLKANVKDNVHYADENVVMYPAGHNVVKYYAENKLQEFINGTDLSRGVTALAVSSDKRFIAVAEESDRAVVFVYNLRTLYKRKQLATPDIRSKVFVSLCFSSDSTLLLTQTGAPDWALVCWAWEKSKLMAMVRTSLPSASPENPIHQVSFNPIDPRYVATTGRNILRFYRIDEDHFTPITESPAMAKRQAQNQNYLCHTWLPGNRTVAGTSAGELLLFHETDLLTVLPSSPADGKSINCLVSFSRGFLSAGAMGTLRMFEPTEEPGQYYVQTKEFNLRVPAGAPTPTIQSMALSPSEDQVAVTLDNCQLMQLSLAHADVLKDDIMFEPMATPMHGPKPRSAPITPTSDTTKAAITGLDVCVRKPLVVTCGIDTSVRVWNYLDKTLELLKYFPSEDSFCVAFHPSGLHILVGFSSKLRLMNLLMDDIRQFKELPIKACREARFANGGHCFAAANGSMIQVYNTYTMEQISTLRGHNSRVLALCWTPSDYSLVSAGIDGAVYQWDLNENNKREGKREGEYVSKGVQYTSVAVNADCTAVFAVGGDRTLKEIEFPGANLGKELDAKVPLGQVVLSGSQHMLFAGVSLQNMPGSVRSYKFPLTGDSFEYPAVSDAVTRMRLSHDDAYLFVAGADGALCVFEVREKDGRVPHRDRETQVPWAEEILVTKTELEEKEALMQELQNNVDELQVNNDYALRMKDISYNERIKKVTEKYASDLEQNKNQYDLLREEKTDLEREYEERLSAMEVSHRAEMQKRESLYQSKIMEEVERYQQLQHETDMQKERWQGKQMELMQSHEAYIKAITDDFEAQLEDVRTQRIDMEEEKDGTVRDWKETRTQMEEDIDTEIEQLKKRYEDKLAAERESTLKYKGENGIMKKKFTALHKDIEEQREEIKAMMEKEKLLREQIGSLDREIVSLRELIHERDVTIGEKEKKIYELKKRNQELEKFKFVLDYKIKGLKRQIEPRENEIADMRRQINEVDKELETFHNSNAELDLLIGSLRKQLDAMQRRIMSQRVKLGSQRSTLSSFQSELHEVVQSIQNPQELRDGVTEMYKRHVRESMDKEQADTAIAKEYTRQKEYLERSIEALKKKLQADSVLHQRDNMRVMQENMNLIREINELRKEAKNVRMLAADTTAKVGKAPSRTGRSRARPSPRTNRLRNSVTTGRHSAAAIIDRNRAEIGALKAEIRRLEGALVASRPVSRERPSAV